MILVDTGPLVAAANRTDAHHAASVAALATAKPPRLVPGMLIAEVSYLLARDAGSAVEAEFLRSFTTGFLTVVDLTATDLGRCAELVEQHSDLPLGATDASLVALAERLEIAELATLDRRHFSIVRPSHVDSLSLIPYLAPTAIAGPLAKVSSRTLSLTNRATRPADRGNYNNDGARALWGT